ncbi:MAG: ribbon-helix-helix protein, CopG family [Pseudomonadota bacterium]|nr:ribbon-helix-helix protein, CopG family [Pseudomonadota bacterium]
MRINARLDDDAAEQVAYLTRVTEQGVSHVVRESVAHYYALVKAQQSGPRRLLASIGKGDSGRSDIAGNLKLHLGESLDAKHGRAR